MLIPCAGHGVPTAGRIRISAAATCVALGLSGCASLAPDDSAKVPFDIPSAWTTSGVPATAGANPVAQWWLRFDDPLLASLVGEALRANTSVIAAQAALRQARALRDVAAAALLPGMTGSGSGRHGTSGGESTGNVFNAALDASWELDLFGANRRAFDASEFDAHATAASLADTQVSIAAETALAYMTLRGSQARLAIAGASLAAQLETLQITLWRLQAGLVTEVEAEQARTSAEQTRAQIPALQTAIEQARNALGVLVGRPPGALADALAAPGPVPQASEGLALSLPAETLRQRPDVRASEFQVTAAAARVAQADAARLPNFKLGGSLGLTALALGSLAASEAVVGTLLASVSLPVFDAGAGRARVRAQEAALDKAQSAYMGAVLGALRDVENALVALRGDRERLARLRAAAAAATNAARLARQRYASGLVDFQVVLETQRTELGTQDSLASAGADVSSDHVRLYKALGGGWVPETGESTRPSMYRQPAQ